MNKIAITSCFLLLSLAPSGWCNDILRISGESGREKTIELEVTPQGVTLDLRSQINSVNISHKSNIVFSPVDGALCSIPVDCKEQPPPTMLYLRKIPTIDFTDEEPMGDGTSLIFVYTESGIYRFKIKPINKNPEQTLVEIE